MTGFLIFQVSVAGPCDILVCVASVYPAFEGVATFSADYFSGESIALLIFVTAFFYTFFSSSLINQRICCIEVRMTDNRFVIIRSHVLIDLTIICVPIKGFIRIGLLKYDISGIFFIGENASNSAGSPVIVFLGWNLFCV